MNSAIKRATAFFLWAIFSSAVVADEQAQKEGVQGDQEKPCKMSQYRKPPKHLRLNMQELVSVLELNSEQGDELTKMIKKHKQSMDALVEKNKPTYTREEMKKILKRNHKKNRAEILALLDEIQVATFEEYMKSHRPKRNRRYP